MPGYRARRSEPVWQPDTRHDLTTGRDLGSLDAQQSAFIIRAMRHDARASEDYFTDLLHRKVTPLRAPIVSVVGEHDRSTEYHHERYQEWQFLSGDTRLRVRATVNAAPVG